MVGHTKCYVKVLIKREEDLVGKRAIVKITDVHKWHIYGEVIERNPKHVHVNFEHHFKGMYGIKKDVDDNIINFIKKEQEDIHATMIFEEKSEKIENENEIESVLLKKKEDLCGLNFGKFFIFFIFIHFILDISNLLLLLSLISLFASFYKF